MSRYYDFGGYAKNQEQQITSKPQTQSWVLRRVEFFEFQYWTGVKWSSDKRQARKFTNANEAHAAMQQFRLEAVAFPA